MSSVLYDRLPVSYFLALFDVKCRFLLESAKQ